MRSYSQTKRKFKQSLSEAGQIIPVWVNIQFPNFFWPIACLLMFCRISCQFTDLLWL